MKKINVEKYKLSEDRLIDFGFQFEDNILVFKRNILNDVFRMEIKLINTDFEIEVYDLDFNEVYSLPFFVNNYDIVGNDIVKKGKTEPIMSKTDYEELLKPSNVSGAGSKP